VDMVCVVLKINIVWYALAGVFSQALKIKFSSKYRLIYEPNRKGVYIA
jgi:hypothetical protein